MKPLVEFNLKPQAACKACINIYQAVYRERSRETRNKKAKVYYQKTKDRQLAYGAAYRERRREELNANQREYAKSDERKSVDRALRAKYEAELTDAVVRRALSKNRAFKGKDVPPELIVAKRLQLQILRTVKNGTNA
jgi:hypothetical protein